ncbi:MAG: signal peptidase II [Alphaproteobacteria bacterium]
MLGLGLAVAAAVVAVDRLVKWWLIAALGPDERVLEVTPFFALVMVWNRGLSFGLLATDLSYLPWLFIAVAAGIVAGLVLWLRRVRLWWLAAGIGLVIGGAVGNVIDRLRYGAVADFFDLHVAGYHWPAFNVADAAISVGVVLLLADALFVRRERSR